MNLDPHVPSVLGDYELVERIGRGGMASLYLARRTGARGFERPVALKVVHPHLTADPDFVDMFVDEANVCSRLSHPSIVHVEELSEIGGRLFMVMEFVDGCSLGKALSYAHAVGRKISAELAVYIVMQIADGLHTAHETRGDDGEPLYIVHRDVSPGNILLSRDGQPKIIDFGIAQFATRIHQTRAKQLKGKVAYMAPEQLRGLPVDRRSDIYSLGIVLWEALASRRAFRGRGEIDLLQHVLHNPPPDLAELRPDLPAALVAAINQALARAPDERFGTARAFAAALGDAVQDALTVSRSDVAELVHDVLAQEGETTSSFQRIGSRSLTSARLGSSGFIRSVRPATNSASYYGAGAMMPDDFEHSPTTRNPVAERGWLTPVLLGLCLVLLGGTLGGLFFAFQAYRVGGGWDVRTEMVRLPPEEPPLAAPPVARSAPAPKPPPPLPPESISTEPVPEESPSRTARADRRPVRRRRGALPPRARPPARPAPAVPTANGPDTIEARTDVVPLDVFDSPSRSAAGPAGRTTRREEVHVGGLRLATQDDVDRANARGDRKHAPARVESGDVILADEYQ